MRLRRNSSVMKAVEESTSAWSGVVAGVTVLTPA
jgi:hypothetical protein